MHIFVISLEKSADRRAAITARLAELGLKAEVFQGIDGQKLTPEAQRYHGRRRRLFYGKDMSIGEIGCAHSHLAVCRTIAERGIARALVLEDDAVLQDTLPAVLSALADCADTWDIVRFLGHPKVRKIARPITQLTPDTTLCRFYGTPGGAYGYVVNTRAAAAIAAAMPDIWMPIDTLHGQVWLHGLRVRGVMPPPVLPDYDIASTIGDGRFDKARDVRGLERYVFPLTRFAFKVGDALAKQVTYWGGVVRDTARKGKNNAG